MKLNTLLTPINKYLLYLLLFLENNISFIYFNIIYLHLFIYSSAYLHNLYSLCSKKNWGVLFLNQIISAFSAFVELIS